MVDIHEIFAVRENYASGEFLLSEVFINVALQVSISVCITAHSSTHRVSTPAGLWYHCTISLTFDREL